MKKILIPVILLLFPLNVFADGGYSSIVMDMDSGRVLYERNAYSKNLIASTTKIMTAIVTIENSDLNRKLVVGDEILEMYANISYFGDGYYGIKEASNYYYDKDPNTLNLDEASLLAGIPNAPSLYNPIDSMEYARSRQKKVLSSMVEYGYITQEQMDEVINNINNNI